MHCPVCHHESRILRSDAGRRRRACDRCGHRWTTVEIDEAAVQRMRELERLVHAAADLVPRQAAASAAE